MPGAAGQTFLDAFSEHRLRRGQPAVSISLPVVEGVGYVADRGLADRLKGSLGLSLDEAQLHTLMRAAVLGPSSALNVGGRSFSFVATPTPEALPWEHFRPLRAMRLRGEAGPDGGQDGPGPMAAPGGGAGGAGGGRRAEASPEAMMEALRTKVSLVTMMDREEVLPERSLRHYGLDSLVSVELRNWIRREYGADLALKDIVAARHLEALAKDIRAQMTA